MTSTWTPAQGEQVALISGGYAPRVRLVTIERTTATQAIMPDGTKYNLATLRPIGKDTGYDLFKADDPRALAAMAKRAVEYAGTEIDRIHRMKQSATGALEAMEHVLATARQVVDATTAGVTPDAALLPPY